MVLLVEGLGDCSRQRLRAVRMGLRKTANGESRISAKELYSLLQVWALFLKKKIFY